MSLKEFTMKYNTAASALQSILQKRPLLLPRVLQAAPGLEYSVHEALGAVADHEDIQRAFPNTYGRPRISLKQSTEAKTFTPLRVGVVLSGGQAPGGHNVIAGIYDYIKKVSTSSVMIGFLDGPQGIYNGQYCVVDDPMMDNYRNTGGFDMIGSGRHKIEKPTEFAAAMANCISLDLDGLVIIGGDDSNTNGAVLAEYFEANKCKTKVCGAPKTIDGDLKVDPYIPISFGFDTACRTYSELIGNLGQDTLSSQKYYHFVRLMGRAASNIALECALQTRPNICLISEEVEAKKMTLLEITKQVVDVIVRRSAAGKDYGLVLLPEGLIEFIPEFNQLIAEINDVLAHGVETTEAAVVQHLSENNKAVFLYLPEAIKQQLLLDRDPHGNVQVAKIETEKLLAETVASELAKLKASGAYSGNFAAQYHSYGYEGRSCFPSPFDATYCYVVGQNVAAMLALGLNGLIASVTNLSAPVSEWQCGGVPITMLCNMEKRHGHMKAVIKKALVELDGVPFNVFKAQRDDWAKYDFYNSPGPLQFFSDSGSVELCMTLTLELMKSDPRLAVETLLPVKTIQDAAPRFGSFTHAPLVGNATAILSSLQRDRLAYRPSLCPAFLSGSTSTILTHTTQCPRVSDRDVMKGFFPHLYGGKLVSITAGSEGAIRHPLKVGVIFCGRQAPGGHDVISGIFDSLPTGSTLLGFVGGTVGLVNNHVVPITAEKLASYRSQGGFELLGRSIDVIDTSSYSTILQTCNSHALNGLVLIGGARTNTSAAYLSEFFIANGSNTKIITTPVDMSGSMKNDFIETAVGFDTATKVTAQVVGNNATDGASAKKYWYFMRIMGQEPSHSTLEVALLTKPNYVILAEEVIEKNMNLSDIVSSIADVVADRASQNKNYGTVLIPEGLLDAIPEIKMLVSELDAIYAERTASLDADSVKSSLTLWYKALLESLPDFMQTALLNLRGSDNSLQLSQAETEKFLAHFVALELSYRKKKGTYKGAFSVVPSFIGYQARGSLPSNFDVTYAYNLGYAATALISGGVSGYVATIANLKSNVSGWSVVGVPITAIMGLDPTVKGNSHRPIVAKAKVDLTGSVYSQLTNVRESCALYDHYENPGPLQFVGPTELVDRPPCSIGKSSASYMEDVSSLHAALVSIEDACRPGASSSLIQIASKNLAAITAIIDMVQIQDSNTSSSSSRSQKRAKTS